MLSRLINYVLFFLISNKNLLLSDVDLNVMSFGTSSSNLFLYFFWFLLVVFNQAVNVYFFLHCHFISICQPTDDPSRKPHWEKKYSLGRKSFKCLS